MISSMRIVRRHFAAINQSGFGKSDMPADPEAVREKAKETKEKTIELEKAQTELSDAQKELKKVQQKLFKKAAELNDVERARLTAINKVFTKEGVPDNAYTADPQQWPSPITMEKDTEVKEQFIKDLIDVLKLKNAKLVDGTIIDTDDGAVTINDDMELDTNELQTKLNGLKAKGATFKRGCVFYAQV